MSGDEQLLNPQIKDVTYGTRDLRKFKIYPMSIADQKRLGTIVQGVLETYFAQTAGGEITEDNMIPFIQGITKIVGDNLHEVLKIVTDLKKSEIESFFEHSTNMQMTEIIEIIVRENFEKPSKNVKSLFETMKELFPLERLSPPSLNDIPSTTSVTSIEEVSEKED
jgi:hypothetical protein